MGKKIAYCLLLMNLIFYPVYGQFLRTDVQLLSGLALPTGAFSGHELQKSGFALPGLNANAKIVVNIWQKLDFTLQSGIILNAIDVGSLGREKVTADPFLEDVVIRSDPFRIIPALAGAQFEMIKFKNITIQSHAHIGVFFSRTPYQLYKPRYFLVGPSYYEITSSSDVSFAYGCGLSVDVLTKSCISVLLSADWMHSDPVYGFISSGVLRTETHPINLINLSLGIAIPVYRP